MSATVISVRAKEESRGTVAIRVAEGGEKKLYTVSEGTYREIGCPLSGEEIDASALAAIAEDDGRRRALARALHLLSFADNNEKTLYMKLCRAGFTRDEAKGATEECVRLGYINERRQIEHAILCAAARLEGPYKITARLVQRGYAGAEVREAMCELESKGEIDFAAARARLMAEKLPRDADRDTKMKLLHRYGYIK